MPSLYTSGSPVVTSLGGDVVENGLDVWLADGILEPEPPDPVPPAGVVLAICEVWRFGTLIDRPLVLDGHIIEDISSRTYRTATLELAEAIDEDSQLENLLQPGGTELRIWRWDRHVNDYGWTLLGRFYYRAANIERTRAGVRIRAHDATELVRENRWTTPYAVTGGIAHTEAVALAIRDRLNEFTWTGARWTDPSAQAITQEWTWGEDTQHDPWDSAGELPRAISYDVYFDRDGVLQQHPIPELDGAPAIRRWVAGDPDEGVDYLDASREVIGRGFNGVKARTEVPNRPPDEDADPVPMFSALVWDNDPESPTFRGLYERPRFLTSSLFTSQEQVDAAAEAELLRNVGNDEDVTIEVVSDPSLVPRIVIELIDAKVFADGLFIVDAVRTPLLGGPSRLSLRRRKLPEVPDVEEPT